MEVFFVASSKFFKFIRGDKEILEKKKPLEKASKRRQLLAFRHKGFGNVWTRQEIKK